MLQSTARDDQVSQVSLVDLRGSHTLIIESCNSVARNHGILGIWQLIWNRNLEAVLNCIEPWEFEYSKSREMDSFIIIDEYSFGFAMCTRSSIHGRANPSGTDAWWSSESNGRWKLLHPWRLPNEWCAWKLYLVSMIVRWTHRGGKFL
jgi:hypothetical protein